MKSISLSEHGVREEIWHLTHAEIARIESMASDGGISVTRQLRMRFGPFDGEVVRDEFLLEAFAIAKKIRGN